MVLVHDVGMLVTSVLDVEGIIGGGCLLSDGSGIGLVCGRSFTMLSKADRASSVMDFGG